MTKEELNGIIEKHGMWIRGEKEGIQASLRGANLREAKLKWADLREADLRGANLRGANLRGAYLPDYMYQVTGCGRDNRPTTYDVLNNQVICGCWVHSKGNTLENFEKRIEDVYGERGAEPNQKYYNEYMSAIKFFKEIRKLNAKRR